MKLNSVKSYKKILEFTVRFSMFYSSGSINCSGRSIILNYSVGLGQTGRLLADGRNGGGTLGRRHRMHGLSWRGRRGLGGRHVQRRPSRMDPVLPRRHLDSRHRQHNVSVHRRPEVGARPTRHGQLTCGHPGLVAEGHVRCGHRTEHPL